MTVTTSIALIGFGEVGQILADDLTAAGVRRLTAFDLAFSDPASVPSLGVAARARVAPAPDHAAAASDADLIICAVTAAQDLAAARAVAAGMKPGAFYLDVNSASPRLKQASADVIEAAGGRYVEAAVMSPIGPKRIASPMLLGGPHVGEFLAMAEPLGLRGAAHYADTVGKAAAAKLCRSVVIKGLEALLAEALLAATHYDVLDTVLGSLTDLLPLADWPERSRYMISRAVEHGIRRAEEMREAAVTVEAAGVAPLMTAAAAERQSAMPLHRAALAESEVAAVLHAMLKDIPPS